MSEIVKIDTVPSNSEPQPYYRFTVIVDINGECYFNVSEMESFAAIAPELIKEHQSHLEEASIIVLDGNVPLDTMRCVLDIASRANIPGE